MSDLSSVVRNGRSPGPRPLLLLAASLFGLFTLSACSTPRQPLPTLIPTLVALEVSRTPPPSFTPIPTLDQSPTPGPSPTPSLTRTPSPTPTASNTPQPTPTSRPQSRPTLDSFYLTSDPGLYLSVTPPTPIPTPVPTFAVGSEVTNVLLMGSDSFDLNDGGARTDSIIIVSINRESRTAAMVSLPRDLYIYVPGWTMNRINTILSREPTSYPGGNVAQMKDAILYNFGLPIHYYAQIDFTGFKKIVDAIGGIEVPVSCTLTDWRLISPELDITVEENYERFTLEPGVHQMDGDLALWYARSRMTTSDFDRGRRQQQLLRAMLQQGVDLNLIAQLPTLWATYQSAVRTDMDVGRMLQLAALAPDIRNSRVQHLYLAGDNIIPWTVPTTGAEVQLPNWPVMQGTLRHLVLPPALGGSNRAPIFVAIYNGTGNPDMSRLAADNLAWQGFAPIIGEPLAEPVAQTSIRYYADNFKGSYDWLLSWVFNVTRSRIELVTDNPRPHQYEVVLGQDYDPCRPVIFSPLPELGG